APAAAWAAGAAAGPTARAAGSAGTTAATIAVAAASAPIGAEAGRSLDEVHEVALLLRAGRDRLALARLHHAHATDALEVRAPDRERLGHPRQAIAGEAERDELGRAAALGGRSLGGWSLALDRFRRVPRRRRGPPRRP